MEESETNTQPEIQPVSPPPKTSFNLKWLIVPILLITLITLISLIFLSRSQTSQKTTNNQQSTISNTPSPSPNPTAGWKTFKSTTNDYVIEYPPDWSSRSVDRGTVISSYVEFSQPVPNVRAKIEISTYDNPKKLSSKEWINNPNKNRQDPDDSVESKPLTIDGIQAYVRVDNSLNSENTVIYLVYLQKDNKIYSFWAGGNKKYEQVLFQILSTFKFLDQPTLTSSSAEKQIGYIKSFNNNVITVDYVQWINCQTSDCPNGYKVVNDNPLLRDFALSPNLEIFLQTYSNTTNGDFNWNEKVSLNQLISWKYYPTTLYWFTIQNNQIIKIEEQYQP